MTELAPLPPLPPLNLPSTAPSAAMSASPAASSRAHELTRRQKAAIIVRLLLNEGADVALADLPDELQDTLTRQMGEMRAVDRTTLADVVQEFASELDSLGLIFPGGISGALGVLEGKISAQTAARLRKQAGVPRAGDPWARISGLAAEALVPIIEAESTEVAAVLLSKLDVSRAAELLGLLPGAEARRITYAVSLTGAITPEAVTKIGASLVEQLDGRSDSAFPDGPVARVGAILNSSQAATRDDVLSGLDEADSGFADLVRKAIFTFANIPSRIDPRDISKIVRQIDPAQLATSLGYALAGELAPAAEFVLTNMSKRMADGLREEISEMDKIKPSEGEAAMSAMISAIRQMEANGEVLFLSEEAD